MNRLHFSLLIALLLAAPCNPLWAQQPRNTQGLDQAVRNVEKSTGGQVVAAEKRNVDGKQKYRIKVLTPSGRVRIIHVDAKE